MGLRRHLRDRIASHNTVELATDDVYHVLSASRRRHLLVVLDDLDADTAHLGELAECVAAREADGSGFEATRIALYQAHLPLLDSLGVVEWERDSGAVIAREPAPALARIVRDLDERIEGRPDAE